MGRYLQLVLDWSEIWALLIPLSVLVFHPKQPAILKPVIVYLIIALFLNITIDVIMFINIHFKEWVTSNNPFYNIHSTIRFTCFSIFFISQVQNSFSTIKKIIALVGVILFFINFLFFDNFFNPNHLSGNLLATEAYFLLVYCMLYYLGELRNESNTINYGPEFWIVTGLSIYVVINFFLFLFYVPIINLNPHLANNMWNVHNIAFIIFCIFITKALYDTDRN